jgi:hypothetical protein
MYYKLHLQQCAGTLLVYIDVAYARTKPHTQRTALGTHPRVMGFRPICCGGFWAKPRGQAAHGRIKVKNPSRRTVGPLSILPS